MVMSATAFKSTSPLADAPHLHNDQDVCPFCERPIPNDQFDEISQRIAKRRREQTTEIESRLSEQFVREKAVALEQARKEAAAGLDREKNLRTALQAQLDQVRNESNAAIEKVKQDAIEREELIRTEARRTAEIAMQAKLADLGRARQESETALQGRIVQAESEKTAAEETSSALKAQLDQVRRDADAAVEKVKQDSSDQEVVIRREASVAAEAAVHEKFMNLERTRVENEARAVAAEQRLRGLQEAHEANLALRLQEQREVMERAKTEALNAEKSAAFEEKLKLSMKVEDLQRSLDKKTAEELGEGAEIDLFEALKAEFQGDQIVRVNKGQPGADILHTVIHNGKECGKLIYDSKNHGAWRNDFVTKLATDQMAAKAEHAILSTRKFPAGARHLHMQDGIILACPSRILALVQIVRQHIVQTHTLRLSNQQRTQKTAALYSFITSERCADLMTRIDTHSEDLLDIQVKERKAHEVTWRRQGELIRSVQKVRAELCSEIDTIIGTAESVEGAQ